MAFISDIVLLVEAQGPRRIPSFQVEINGCTVQFSNHISNVKQHFYHIECKVTADNLGNQNRLCVIMNDKQEQDNIDPVTGAYIDHFISVKQIRIQDIDADAVLYKQSYVEHTMPAEWVEQMRQCGHEILPRYQGSDLHINGRMTFEFSLPFWLEKTKFLNDTVPKSL